MNAQLANRITERVLSEAMPKTIGLGWSDGLPINMKVYQDAVAKMTPAEKQAFDAKLKAKSSQVKKAHVKAESDFWNTHKHDILFAASIAALLIPIPGVNYGVSLALSTAASATNAALYWQEGNRKDAMQEMFWALLPVIGPVIKLIPAVAKLGSAGMRQLFKLVIKAKNGAKVVFTKLQKEVLKALPKAQKPIGVAFKEFGEKLAKKQAVKTATRKAKRAAVRAPFVAGDMAAGAAAYNAAGSTSNQIWKSMEWDQLDQMDATGTSKIFAQYRK